MNALARYEFFIGMDVYDLYLGCQSQDHTHTDKEGHPIMTARDTGDGKFPWHAAT